MHVTQNNIHHNVAANTPTHVGIGGGVINVGQSQFLDANLISHNTAAINGPGYGGGMALGGNVALHATNTVLNSNNASDGMALYIEENSQLTFTHTTIARHGGDNGTAVWLSDLDFMLGNPHSSVLNLTNTIVAGYSVGVRVDTGHEAHLSQTLWHNVPTRVNGAPGSITNVGNFTGNPQFAADGYHITATSPARGRGLASSVQMDIDGQARPAQPALGADEYWRQILHLPIIARP